MADQRTTDLDPIATIPDSAVFDVVDTTNTTQDPAGSSFKITKANLLKEATAAILLNTAKVGITTGQAAAILLNTAKVGITTDQAAAILLNTAKVGITPTQAAAILLNTAKTGITTTQAAAIIDNTAKVGITTGQAAAILLNTAKVGITTDQAAAILLNSAKVGITTAQATAIVDNTAKVGISTVAQTITGVKTFSSDIVINGISFGRGLVNSSSNLIAGFASFLANSAGFNNTVFGGDSLINNVNGSGNISVGQSVLKSNISGSNNVAVGRLSLDANTNASNNIALGVLSLNGNITGSNTVAIGVEAGRFIADGVTIATVIDTSVLIGRSARVLADSQSGQIVIGSAAVGLGTNTTVIGGLSTVFGRFWGRLLVGTSVDNGIDQGQFAGSVICTTLKTSAFTVATLPAPPAQGLGARAFVTDALNPTFLGTLTGGGSVRAPVFYNGTAWVSA